MRKRSKYRPKGVRLDVVNYVVNGLKPIAAHDAATVLRIKNHAALTALTQGKAARDDINTLIEAFNTTEALVCVSAELGEDWREEIRQAQDALYAVATRGVANDDKFVLTGLEMKALNIAMELHDAQMEKATVIQLEKATAIVNQRIRNNQTRRIG